MNLVKLIQEQLSGNTLNELSSTIGAEPEATGAAASAAVPTLLSGLANMFSSSDGAKRLGNVLSSPDIGAMGNFANLLGGDRSSLIGKGSGLLGSLFGDSITNMAASAIGRFSGLNPSAAKSLLALLMPLVLGKVASQWKSQGGTPGALTNLFAEQKRNIDDAMPTGFSLADIPGLGGIVDAAPAATQATRRAAETAGRAAPSMASWMVPLAIAIACGFLLWNVLRPKPAEAPDAAQATPAAGQEVVAMKPALPNTPEIPSAAQFTNDLNATFKSLGETFTGIKDAASAETAAPKLQELNSKIDALKAMFGRLPEAARTPLESNIESQVKPIRDQAQQALATPGLSEKIRTLITQIVTKLEEWNVIERAG